MSLIKDLKATGFNFKKGLGQNFIADENFLQSVVAGLGLRSEDRVVEVGTGAGTLTRVLARNFAGVVTYEVDESLRDVLGQQFRGFDNIDLRFEDALRADIDPEIVIANIPYYITTPLIMKFMKSPSCRMICVLIQDDVAKRIVAKPGGKEYGALSVAVQSWGDAKIVKRVPRGMFVPVPGVDSCFIVIVRKNDDAIQIDERLLKGLFAARRKTIANGLKQLGIDLGVLDELGIDPQLRPENLTVQQFIAVSDKIRQIKNTEKI